MGKVVVGMTMSLDGFVSDRAGSVSSLYPDFATPQFAASLEESIRNTGAVVMGRRAFEMGDPDLYADHYEYQVPIFVLTHQPPSKLPRQNERLTFTFITGGIEQAIAQAKAAAGDKDVTVIGGANTLQQCLRAGLADELHIDIMPVLLNDGLRLFDHLGLDTIPLEKLGMGETDARTHLRFRVGKPS
jgi:dihydrofolate reductase